MKLEHLVILVEELEANSFGLLSLAATSLRASISRSPSPRPGENFLVVPTA
jgi:hypothetical protein